MVSDKLPSILYQPNGNSLSLERVIKMAIDLIEDMDDSPVEIYDKVTICLDDLHTMLKSIDRG